MAATNGTAFSRLWNEDTSAYGGDDSAADMALCNHLAFWTGNDPARMDMLFRQSGLYREKWERQDYRNSTITKAIESVAETYSRRNGTTRSEEKMEQMVTRDIVQPSHNELIENVANEGFLKSYVDYATKQTDTPKLFHLFTGLAIVGASLGNKVFVRAWGKNIYSNLWIVTVAPSGFYRKSTAINLGTGNFA